MYLNKLNFTYYLILMLFLAVNLLDNSYINLQQKEASVMEFSFCFAIMNITFLTAYYYADCVKSERITWIMALFFCLFAFWDTDFFTFRRGFYTNFISAKDPLYEQISDFAFDSYTLFRFLVWGTALYLYKCICKRFELSYNISIYIFIFFFLLTFSYARVSLAMACFFYGLSFMIKPNNINLPRRAFSIMILFLLAFWAHRSILVLICISPISLIPLTKKRLFLLLLLLPIFVFVLNIIVNHFLVAESVSSSFSGSAQHYVKLKTEMNFNWKYSLMIYLRNISFYIATCFLIWKLIIRNIDNADCYIYKLLTITIVILIIASSFFIISGSVGFGLFIIGYRYLYMLGIPLCTLLAYAYENNYCSKRSVNLILIPSLLYSEGFILGKILA